MNAEETKLVLITSFIITLCVFLFGLLLNYGLDYVRVEKVILAIEENEVKANAYFIENEFIEIFEGEKCLTRQESLREIKKQSVMVGSQLTRYGIKSWFNKKDFDYLKRKYFLLELKLLTLLQNYNEQCDEKNIPVIFFYSIDEVESQRQGYILEELSKEFPNEITVLSFDKEYQDEEVVNLLREHYNVKKTPTTIIEDDTFEGLAYMGQLNATVRSYT